MVVALFICRDGAERLIQAIGAATRRECRSPRRLFRQPPAARIFIFALSPTMLPNFYMPPFWEEQNRVRTSTEELVVSIKRALSIMRFVRVATFAMLPTGLLPTSPPRRAPTATEMAARTATTLPSNLICHY